MLDLNCPSLSTEFGTASQVIVGGIDPAVLPVSQDIHWNQEAGDLGTYDLRGPASVGQRIVADLRRQEIGDSIAQFRTK